MTAVRALGRLRHGLLVASLVASACSCPGGPSTTAGAVEVDASDAVLYGGASRLRVRGAARIDESIAHRVVLTTERSRTETWFHLVPVVDDSWNEGDPIPLFITSASTEADVESWKRALAAALSRGPVEVEIVARAGLQPRERPRGWHEALEALAADDGPTPDPRAPIAIWPPP